MVPDTMEMSNSIFITLQYFQFWYMLAELLRKLNFLCVRVSFLICGMSSSKAKWLLNGRFGSGPYWLLLLVSIRVQLDGGCKSGTGQFPFTSLETKFHHPEPVGSRTFLKQFLRNTHTHTSTHTPNSFMPNKLLIKSLWLKALGGTPNICLFS